MQAYIFSLESKYQPYNIRRVSSSDVLITSFTSLESSPACLRTHAHIHAPLNTVLKAKVQRGWGSTDFGQRLSKYMQRLKSKFKKCTQHRTYRGYFHISPSFFLAMHAALPMSSLFLATNVSHLPSVPLAILLVYCHWSYISLHDVIGLGFLYYPFVSLSR